MSKRYRCAFICFNCSVLLIVTFTLHALYCYVTKHCSYLTYVWECAMLLSQKARKNEHTIKCKSNRAP